jgi:ABC-2 type transport system permease protein
MAAVADSSGLARQLWLVVAVRWQIFRNGLRSASERAHVAGTIAVGVFAAVFAAGVSAAIGFGSFAIAESRNWFGISLLLWGMFLFWQFLPVLAIGMNPGFDGRNLLRFPLRFSAFLLLSAVYGLSDPLAIIAILWHVAMGIGISIVRPDLIFWTSLTLIVSILMNLLFNRFVFSWLERVLAKRRTREVFTALLILGFVSLQFSGQIVRRNGPAVKRALDQTSALWDALPPGLGGVAIGHAADGEPLAALAAVGLLGVYSLVFGALFALRVRAQFRGEDLGESVAPVRQKPVGRRAAATASPIDSADVRTSTLRPGILSGPVGAIFMKELRYFYRNSMLMMNVFMPLILIVFFSLSSVGPRRTGGGSFSGAFGGDFAYPAAVAYLVLLTMNYFPNSLAYEGRGIERLFLAPIKFRDVMLGKNLFQGALLALEAIMALALVTALGHPPSLVVLLATWSALLFAALIDLGAGNWLSLQFPRRFEFGVRRQRPSGLTVFITFALFFVTMGVIAAAAFLSISFVGWWLLPIVYIALSAGALAIYRLILNATTKQAIVQRDELLEQLSR